MVKVKGKFVPVQNMKTCKWRGSTVYLLPFVISALQRGERLTSCPGRFTPEIEHLYPLNRRLRGPQSLSGCFREEEKFWPWPGFEVKNFQPESLLVLQLAESIETLNYKTSSSFLEHD